MSTKLEELEKRLNKARELIGNLDRYCCGTSCSSCIMQQNGCGAAQAKSRVADLEAEIRSERNRVKTIEEAAKTREEMTKAMLSVKRDDWDIVNISYAEDDTTAVAFIKKCTELKPNMEPVKQKTDKDRLFEVAREVAKKDVCNDLNCCECPMKIKFPGRDSECVKPYFRKRLKEL